MKAQNNILKQICSGAEDNEKAVQKIIKVKNDDKSYKQVINEIKEQNFNLNSGDYKQRLKDFRKQLKKNNLDGFILKTSDKYLNEYISLDFYHLQYLSGFTGSLGLAIVTNEKAVLFVDGRYTIQAKQEVLPEYFEVLPYTLQEISNYIKQNTSAESKIAIDSRVHSIKEVNTFKSILKEKACIVDFNLVDNIWHNKALEPVSEVLVHGLEFAVESTEQKKQMLLKEFANDYGFFLITDCSSISWLLNIRAKDVFFTPVVLSYLLISKEGNISLFIDSNKLTDEVKEYFALQNITIYSNSSVLQNVKSLTKGKTLAICNNSPYIFFNLLQKSCSVFLVDDFCTLLKSKKSPKVIENIKKSHIKDGIAVSKLLMELETFIKRGEEVSEYEIAILSENVRKEQDLFFSLSFNSIVGIDGNGAIVHYRPLKNKSKFTHKKCSVLIDSGAHYFDGTTDVTRSFSFAERKDYNTNYTLVLKGLLALSNLKFPKGITGDYIDILARQFLFNSGMQYQHGTGHGVGYFLNVHEGPQSISPAKNNVPLQEGMVLSNEPGVYFNNDYGIRLENLIVVKESAFKGFLEFEEITLVPFNKENIVLELLTDVEKQQLNSYHSKVYEKLSMFIKDSNLLNWLDEKTKPI